MIGVCVLILFACLVIGVIVMIDSELGLLRIE